jgi:aminoglycoside N3'-acetyltransferase
MSARSLLKGMLPAAIREPLARSARWLRRRGELLRARLRGPVTRASLRRDLERMGLRRGELLMVHSSLSGLGFVEGGAESVLAALCDVLGEEATLLVPVYPLDRPARDWLATDRIYEPGLTASRLGVIGETFRRRADVAIGPHPTHPIAGRGPLATEMLARHGAAASPFGDGSVFDDLERRRGRILALGSPFTHVSAFHLVEERLADFPEPAWLPGVMEARVRAADGSVQLRPVRVQDPALGTRRLEARPDWARRILDECRRRGAVTEHPAGHGRAYLFDAHALENALEDMASEGITIYEPQ